MTQARIDATTAIHAERAVRRHTRNVSPALPGTGSQHGLATDSRRRGRSGASAQARLTLFGVRIQVGHFEEFYAAI